MNKDLQNLFVNELQSIYDGELQICQALPKLINETTHPELREALSKHLKETENQVTRLKRVFALLKMSPTPKACIGLQGIIKEADQVIAELPKKAVLDAGIIAGCQKVEHLEIATYGSLIAWAKQLGYDAEIADLLQDNLDEEGAADKKLTKLAEGSIFTSGINKEAAEASTTSSHKSRK